MATPDFGQLGTGAIGTGAFVENVVVYQDIVSIEKIENGYMVQENPIYAQPYGYGPPGPPPVKRFYCINLVSVSDFLREHFEKGAAGKGEAKA